MFRTACIALCASLGGCALPFPAPGDSAMASERGIVFLDDVTNGLDDQPSNAGSHDPQIPDGDRKMIHTASYKVMVASVDEGIRKFTDQVRELGGYLSRRQNATLTVRIPAAKFQALTATVPDLGRVISESMQADDVTDKHFDLSIRLENAEKSRKRLLDLLDRATKMEDVIQIEAALRRLTGEIESMKGQLKLLNDRVAMATVTVDFQQNAPPPTSTRRRKVSHFSWINSIGIEQDLKRERP